MKNKNEDLFATFQNWVLNVSKATNKASLVVNRVLLHCLNNKLPLPDLTDQTFFEHCLKVGEANLGESYPIVKTVWKKYFSDYPSIPKFPGDSNVYGKAAKTYMTNLKNSLTVVFQRRQKKFVRLVCEHHEQDITYCYPLICAINGWKCTQQMPDGFQDFVSKQRRKLGLNEGEILDKAWLNKHLENILRYYHYILKCLHGRKDIKKFTLAPLSKIKCHFITIDTRVLWEILKNLGQIPGINWEKFQEQRDTYWKNTFNFKKFPKKKQFSYTIQTDGVSVCAHFLSPKQTTSGNIFHIPQLPQDQRVIAIDPGRTNLMFGIEKLPDGKVVEYRLTRKQYYSQSGFTKGNKKAKNWTKSLKDEEDVFKLVSLKTIDESKHDEFLRNYLSVYDALWNEKTKKKWGRENFRKYCLKQKCLDKFFSSMGGTEENNDFPVIAYGAAKFNPSGKHELSVPTTSLSKKCSDFYHTIMVDEFRTTKLCHKCENPISPTSRNVKDRNGEYSYREVRGLRWCSSTKTCRNFQDRDMNAAQNILKCFLAGDTRPPKFCRNYGETQGKPKSLRIR